MLRLSFGWNVRNWASSNSCCNSTMSILSAMGRSPNTSVPSASTATAPHCTGAHTSGLDPPRRPMACACGDSQSAAVRVMINCGEHTSGLSPSSAVRSPNDGKSPIQHLRRGWAGAASPFMISASEPHPINIIVPMIDWSTVGQINVHSTGHQILNNSGSKKLGIVNLPDLRRIDQFQS
jgi:hypothetical protein